jgi:hypothetical protein
MSPGDHRVLPAIQRVMRRVSRMVQSEYNSMVMRRLPVAPMLHRGEISRLEKGVTADFAELSLSGK